MALTTEQVLVLNNLIYMSAGEDSPMVGITSDCRVGRTVGEWMHGIDVSQIEDDRSYGSFMTGRDWKNIIRAVKNDETLMSLTIAETHIDSKGGGGQSAIFTSESTGDAVVVFKGTADREWGDNFTGGNVTDTPYQENALNWYQDAYKKYGLSAYEITVTGHSKGGNKAKYVTLLDGTVDRCVSFDGQGFSDEFVEKYADQIAARQTRIENHNVDYDYVNLLLNDVGKATFYKGHDYGDGGFLENHCPNTFMNFGENGDFSITVNPDGQAPEMAALDTFLNNLIRSMPEGQQTETLACLAVIADNVFSAEKREPGESLNLFVELFGDSQYSDELAYVLAYTMKYEQAHPEFKKYINSVLRNFGMGDYTQYVNVVTGILNFREDYAIIGTVDFERLSGWALGIGEMIPDWMLGLILKWVKKEYGVSLTVRQLKNLLRFAKTARDDMRGIRVQDNGGDIRVASEDPMAAMPSKFYVCWPRMRDTAREAFRLASSLDRAASEVEAAARDLRLSQQYGAIDILRVKLRREQAALHFWRDRAREMGIVMEDVARRYEAAENAILDVLN